MRKWLTILRPAPWFTRRLMLAAVVVGVGTGAFCWGRHGALPEADAQQRGAPPPLLQVASTPGSTTVDYSRRVVAYVYDNIPITREELGEYLIARFGKERLEFVINRKIVELECKARGIVVTEAEIDRQLQEDIRSFGRDMTLQRFVHDVLKRFSKSLYEWREDVIRPKLELTALVRPLVKVTPQDVQNEFEAKYGPKVHCRMIVLKKDNPHREKVWQDASQSEAAFKEQAKGNDQVVTELRAREGDVPPIHTHFPDPAIEKAAFQLKDGQVSGLIQVAQDGSWVILRRENFVPPDRTKRFEDERPRLVLEMADRKLQMQIPEYFRQLRERARVRDLLNPRQNQAAVSIPSPMPPVPRAN